jgi:hypothetical protein
MKLTVAVAVAALIIAAAAAVGAGSKSGGTSDFGVAAQISPHEIMLRSGPTLPVDEFRDLI